MIDKIQPFDFFQAYGERSMVGSEASLQYVQGLLKAEDGGEPFFIPTLVNFQSFSVTGMKNSKLISVVFLHITQCKIIYF